MAVAFVAAANANSNSTSVTCNKPTGTADGDIMLALVIVRQNSGAPTITAPNGWTELLTQTVSNARRSLYWKRASSEGANYQFSHDGSAGQKTQVTIGSFSGCVTSGNPYDCTSNTAYSTNNTTLRAASMTPSLQPVHLVFVGFVSISATITPPGNFTERAEYEGGDTAYVTYVADRLYESTDATGNIDATLSAGTTAKHAMMVALKPSTGTAYEKELTATSSTVAIRAVQVGAKRSASSATSGVIVRAARATRAASSTAVATIATLNLRAVLLACTSSAVPTLARATVKTAFAAVSSPAAQVLKLTSKQFDQASSKVTSPASGDDGHLCHTGGTAHFFIISAESLLFGWDYDNSRSYTAFMRFGPLDVPRGATILSAYLTVTGYATTYSKCRIRAVKADDYTSPNTHTAMLALMELHTTAWVLWDGTLGQIDAKTSSDIKAVVQEIIDRNGWSSGNHIGLHFCDADQYEYNGQVYAAYARDTVTESRRPYLVVTYLPRPTSAAVASILKAKMLYRTLTATSAAVATVVRRTFALRTAASSSVAALVRAVGAVRSTTSNAAGSLRRAVSRALSTTSSAVATVAIGKWLNVTFEAVSSAVATVATKFIWGMILTTTSSATASIVRAVFATRATTAASYASLSKASTRLLSAASSASPVLIKHVGTTLSAVSQAVLTFVGALFRYNRGPVVCTVVLESLTCSCQMESITSKAYLESITCDTRMGSLTCDVALSNLTAEVL